MKKILYFILLFFIIITLNGCSYELEINGLDEVSVNDCIFLTHNYQGNHDAKWSSSDEDIAIVSEGAVTGISVGNVVITLTINGKTAQKEINVVYPKIDITIESKSTLFVGEKYRFHAIVPEEYQGIDEGKWSSGNENLITIDNKGVSIPLAVGETYICYEYFGNIVKTYITIDYKEATGVALEGPDTVSVNCTLSLNTIFYPENSHSDCVYSSSDETIATVDENGIIKGLSVGETVITVSLKDNPNIKSTKTIKVILKPQKLSFKDNGIEYSSSKGELKQLNLLVNNEEYSEKYKNMIKYTISNPNILITNGQYYLGLTEGEALVTAESIYDSNIRAEIKIKITNNNINDTFTKEQLEYVEEILSKMTIRQKVGQMFMVGFSGTSITNTLKNAINEYNFGNVIYMGANVTNPQTIQKMSKDIQDYMYLKNSVYAFISTDQEGGRVARLQNGATHFVSNMAIGATNDFSYAHKQGVAMGKELLYYGINMDLAPVLDVNNNHENPVIGVRSYSDDSLMVSQYGINLIKGLQENGVIACPKHFPGHGNTNVDSHYGLPVITSNKDELYQVELAPFINAINNGMDCIMTTHIIFNAIDEKYPATLSEKVITGLLRNELGYNGLVATDGMEMNAVAKYFGSYDETAVLAVKAGVDLLLYTSLNNPANAYNGIIKAINNGEITEERINESVRRILLTKLKYNILSQEVKIESDFDQLLKLNNNLNIEIACKSLTIAKGTYKEFDKNKNTLIIAPSGTGVADKLKGLLTNNGFIKCDAMTLNSENDLSNIIKVLNNYDQIVYANSNLKTKNDYNSKIVDEIKKVNKNSIIVALDSPYDYLQYNNESVDIYVCLYGKQEATIQALSKLLCNDYKPTAVLPIDKSLFE